MGHNVNVPFSWELKPGVSKVTTSEDSSIDISHFTLKLPPPPCHSKSDRFRVKGLQGVITDVLPSTRSSGKKGYVDKEDDPFVAAYRICTDEEHDACRGTDRARKNVCSLSCKYSCTVSGDNVVRVSQCLKEKAREEHRERK